MLRPVVCAGELLTMNGGVRNDTEPPETDHP